MAAQPEVNIALTFDDGPAETSLPTGLTTVILGILEGKEVVLKKPVKATFFVESSRIDSDQGKDILKNMKNKGHDIAIHGADIEHHKSHPLTDNLLDKLLSMKSLINTETGLQVTHVRPPDG